MVAEFALAREVGETLAERGLTLATAESLTGGLLGAAVTAVSGASRYYLGGIVAYATEMKPQLLGVDAEVLAAHGAVSEQTVTEMALGVQRLTGADYALATSGVAGPDGQDGHEPGEVWICVAGPRIGSHEPALIALRFDFDGDRDAIRSAAVETALDVLRDLLQPG